MKRLGRNAGPFFVFGTGTVAVAHVVAICSKPRGCAHVPWSAANPLRGLVGLEALHLGCLIGGVLGLVLLLAWKRD